MACLRLLALASVLFLGIPVAAAVKVKKEGRRKDAPQFELKDSTGATVHLSDYTGKVVLLDFWATWCAPCKGAVPWLIELSEQYRAAGLVVVGISMDEDGWKVITPFVEQMKIPYPILAGDKRTAYLYGDVASLPLAFFIDRNQKVAAIHLGTANRAAFEKTIKILLEKPPTS